MQDPTLNRLIAALDALAGGDLRPLAADIDEANARLARLGGASVLADNSPYLAFMRRVIDDKRVAAPSMAASA